MLAPSPQPEASANLIDQIGNDLKNTIEAKLKINIKELTQKQRNSKNPKLADKQAEETRQATSRHQLSVTNTFKQSRAARRQVAPSSATKNLSIQPNIKEDIHSIKEKFFNKIFKMIPPSIMIFLSYFLHINLKKHSENNNLLGNMNINLPIIGSVNIGKLIKDNIDKTSDTTRKSNLSEVLKGNQLSSNPQFLAKVDQIVSKIGCSRAALLKIMRKESGINPHAINGKTHATCLIQFIPSTARHLGTTVKELANMSGIQQLDYVEKFFAPYFGKIHSYANLYLATFYPAALGKPNNFVLGSKKSDSYARKVAKQNPAISRGKHYVTVADFYRYAGKEPRAIA